MRKRVMMVFFVFVWVFTLNAQNSPSTVVETSPPSMLSAKPGTRWWWHGSAVDRENLQWSLDQYAQAGIGTVEITPIFGVQGNEKNDRPFLSPEWMQSLRDVEDIAAKKHIQVDMNCGTGWPFGGPEVPLEEAACTPLPTAGSARFSGEQARLPAGDSPLREPHPAEGETGCSRR